MNNNNAEVKAIRKAVGLDAIYCIDYETYYDDDYSLRKMATTEYITDERFEAQLVAVQKDTWETPRVFTEAQFKAWAKTVNWARAGMLGHHTQFDGLIASHHHGVRPRFYFDTMSMARPMMPVVVGGSLKRVCQAFGRQAKQRAQALVDVKGRRFKTFTKAQLAELKAYAGDDVEDTWFLFQHLLPNLPINEIRLIDATVRMYTQPTLVLAADEILAVLEVDMMNKDALIKSVGVPKTHLTSKPKFAELLEAEGVDVPTKRSVKRSESAGEDIYDLAMSKQDLEFMQLAGHENPRVRQLMAARLALSSNALENRCRLLHSRADIGPQPVYLNYCGAKTTRWSGGDGANWQNLASKRREGGQALRAAICAPPGHVLIIADQRQIEARMNAWTAGQHNIVEAFRAFDKGEGPDIYRYVAATAVYNKPIEDITDTERFLGKGCVLALGFQAGAPRFANMLRVGAIGPAIDISDAEAKAIHTAWRQANPYIVSNWRSTHSKVTSAFVGRQRIADGPVSYESVEGPGGRLTGWMHLPNGMAIRYDDLEFDETGGVSYVSEYRINKIKEPTIIRTRLYGGMEVENRTQALARVCIGDQMVELLGEVKNLRIAMMTHDEIVGVVPYRQAKKALAAFVEIMSVSPPWAPDLPLSVDAHVSDRYDK